MGGRLSYIIYQLANIIYLLMLVAVFLSWIPNLNREKEPWYSIIKFADFFFKPFRKIIPPLGGLDFSPILAFMVVGLVTNLLIRFLVSFGL